MISDLQVSDPLVQKITAQLRARLPQASAIIFFGSRVAGCADEFSDYDVMVLLPNGLEEDARDQVKRAMRAAFPKIKLDLVFGSARALLASLRVEAHYRFWLANGIATFGQIPTIKHFPPLYKDALDSRLNVIGSEIKVVEAWSRNLHQEARGYLRILKQLVLIEHALKHDYSNRSLNADVEKMLGTR
jgi:predicted nucleotidyltransferase